MSAASANQRTAAAAELEESVGDDQSEDEEWTFLSKLKGLKQKMHGKIASKFKS